MVIRSLIKTQPGAQWNAAREFRRRLKLRFDRESIEIPFPQRKVHVHVDEGGRHTPRIAAAGAAGG
jgi:small conductance mechanosensitive channel